MSKDELIMSLAERVAAQSELLSRRAERKESAMDDCIGRSNNCMCDSCRLVALEESHNALGARYRGLDRAVKELLYNSPCGLADPDDDARYQRAKAKVKKLLNCS